MEAVYQWVQQIAVFAVIAFLVLYLMGNHERKFSFRFYLSMMMILLVLKPAAGLLNLDQVLTEKMKVLEENTELSDLNGQIQQAAAVSGKELLNYVSEKALSWIDGLVQNKNLEVLDGKVIFDEKTMQQNGEVVISGVELTVSRTEKSLSEIQPILESLKNEIADAFQINQSAVTVKAGVQEDDS